MGLARNRRLLAVGAAAVAAIALTAPPATGAVTIGQVGPPTVGACEGFDTVQATTTLGNSYTVPGTGTITSWTTYGGPSAGTHLKLKIFRLVAAPATYQAVGHSGPQPITPDGTAGNTFSASIPVQAGDLLGVNATSWCILAADGGQQLVYMGDLADGASAPFSTPSTRRLNIQATFVPDNNFKVARTSRNRNKGTATLLLDLPNPGQLTATGKGAKVVATSPKPQGSLPAPGGGPSQLLVSAKGRKRVHLNDTGKVKLRLTVTYTPTGGDPKTQSVKVKLKKKV